MKDPATAVCTIVMYSTCRMQLIMSVLYTKKCFVSAIKVVKEMSNNLLYRKGCTDGIPSITTSLLPTTSSHSENQIDLCTHAYQNFKKAFSSPPGEGPWTARKSPFSSCPWKDAVPRKLGQLFF